MKLLNIYTLAFISLQIKVYQLTVTILCLASYTLTVTLKVNHMAMLAIIVTINSISSMNFKLNNNAGVNSWQLIFTKFKILPPTAVTEKVFL